MTRGATKNQQSRTDGTTSLTSSRSNSISSIDRFELLETKLVKSLIEIISEKFEEFEERITNKFEALLASTKSEVAALNVEVDRLKTQISNIQQQMDGISRENRLTDAIITGIPCCPNESPQQLLSNISTKIGHALSPYASAFRIRSIQSHNHQNGKNKSLPLIAKFSSESEQRLFIQKFRRFGHLQLNQLSSDFYSDSRVNVYESLTKSIK